MATGRSPRTRSRSASAIAMSVLPMPVGPNSATTSRPLRGPPAIGSLCPVTGLRQPREQALLAGERRAGGGLDLHVHELTGRRGAGEVHCLVVAVAAAQPRRVRPRRSLHEHVHRPADEAL